MPRPSKFTEKLLTTICEGLAMGVPLAKMCREDPKLPDQSTVHRWMAHPENGARVSQSIARARELGFDWLASECMDIADDTSGDYITKTRPDGSTYVVVDKEHVMRSKLRIETRLKLLAKWDPKRFGDLQQLRIGDPDGNPLSSLMQAVAANGRPRPPGSD